MDYCNASCAVLTCILNQSEKDIKEKAQMLHPMHAKLSQHTGACGPMMHKPSQLGGCVRKAAMLQRAIPAAAVCPFDRYHLQTACA